MISKHLVIVAGDPSADRHGESLIKALRERDPALRFSALGGDHLKTAADRFIFPLVGVGGFGFLEPLAKLPLLWSVYKQIRRVFQNDPPNAVVLMDYYGFNIHVAKLAKRLSIPVFYYISPQVWASRPGRIGQLAKVVTRMLVIFPFEEALYRERGVPVTYVGHPLLERLPDPSPPLASAPPQIGLLPGSRLGTVLRHLPIMAETTDIVHAEFPGAQFLFFRPPEIAESYYRPFVKDRPWARMVSDPTFDERRRLTVALSVSGTAALENMVLGIPMIIMYRLSPITYWIARALIRVPFVGIPNLLAKRRVVPEYLQKDATPAQLAEAIISLLQHPERRDSIRSDLLALRQQLKEGGSARAAEEILKFLAETKASVSAPSPAVHFVGPST